MGTLMERMTTLELLEGLKGDALALSAGEVFTDAGYDLMVDVTRELYERASKHEEMHKLLVAYRTKHTEQEVMIGRLLDKLRTIRTTTEMY